MKQRNELVVALARKKRNINSDCTTGKKPIVEDGKCTQQSKPVRKEEIDKNYDELVFMNAYRNTLVELRENIAGKSLRSRFVHPEGVKFHEEPIIPAYFSYYKC